MLKKVIEMPADASPGDLYRFLADDGRTVEIRLPDGADARAPGEPVEIYYPPSTVPIFNPLRGDRDESGLKIYKCVRCGKSGQAGVRMKACGKCHKARYCDAACQKAAWKAGHKHSCPAPLPTPATAGGTGKMTLAAPLRILREYGAADGLLCAAACSAVQKLLQGQLVDELPAADAAALSEMDAVRVFTWLIDSHSASNDPTADVAEALAEVALCTASLPPSVLFDVGLAVVPSSCGAISRAATWAATKEHAVAFGELCEALGRTMVAADSSSWRSARAGKGFSPQMDRVTAEFPNNAPALRRLTEAHELTKSMLHGLRQHKAHAGAVQYACYGLSNILGAGTELACCDDASGVGELGREIDAAKDAAMAAGVVSDVLGAMAAHKACDKVLEQGLCVLSGLTIDYVGGQTPRPRTQALRRRVAGEGLLGVLVEAMVAFPHHVNLQVQAMHCLCNVTIHSQETQQQAVDAGVLPAIIQMMRLHPHDPELSRAGRVACMSRFRKPEHMQLAVRLGAKQDWWDPSFLMATMSLR